MSRRNKPAIASTGTSEIAPMPTTMLLLVVVVLVGLSESVEGGDDDIDEGDVDEERQSRPMRRTRRVMAAPHSPQ